MTPIANAARRGVVVDMQALQSPATHGRGIGRYALQWALALETHRPDLVTSYVLNPDLGPPDLIDELLASNKVRYADRSVFDDVALLHVMSPLDGALAIESLWPSSAVAQRCALTATVYDLIPALDLEHELIEAIDRRRYRLRLELVRACDELHVLSQGVARDIAMLLGKELPVRVVGAAAAPMFCPPDSKVDATRRAAERFGTAGLSYVLYPSGHHPRKNNETLIAAWAEVPASVHAQRKLVIAGAFPDSTVHHFAHLAHQFGIDGEVIVPGEIDDDAWLALYQGAELVCFPSLAEGFGLPVAEALSCAVPVIVSNRAAHDELVEDFARFDPTTPASIAGALSDALSDSAQRDRLAHQQHLSVTTWEQVAQRTGASFDELLSRRTTHPVPVLRRERPRIAFVTPLPPAPTGIARYNYRLLEELVELDVVDIDVFVEGQPQDALVPAGLAAHHVAALRAIEVLRGGYDEVFYTVGNSHHHLGALAMLRLRKGVVISHDVRLTNLYRHEHGDPGLVHGGFARSLRAMYGEQVPDGLGQDGLLSTAESEQFGVMMAREIIGAARQFLVSSHAAAHLAYIDAGERVDERVGVLSFAMEAPSGDHDFVESLPPSDGETDRSDRGSVLEELGQRLLVAHFGIVDASKRPELLIEAFAVFHDQLPDSALAFVGPIAHQLVDELRGLSASLGIGDAVFFTGAIAPVDYRGLLGRADIAVQLRREFNGEASAAVGECLSSGVATVVTRIGWFDELPDDAVVKVSPNVTAQELAALLGELAGDEERRVALADRALDFASEQSFARTAKDLVELAGLSPSN